jgi:hypothetical protein
VNEVSDETLFFAVDAVLDGQFLPDRPLTPLESGTVESAEDDRSELFAVVQE